MNKDASFDQQFYHFEFYEKNVCVFSIIKFAFKLTKIHTCMANGNLNYPFQFLPETVANSLGKQPLPDHISNPIEIDNHRNQI